MKILIFLFFLFSKIYSGKNKRYDLYVEMLNWGKQNDLKINGIALNFSEPFEEKYLANKEIKKGEILMKIPRKLMLTFDSILSNSSKKQKKIWEKLKDEPTLQMKVKYHCFITYIIMKAFEKKKGKLYKHFKQFLEFSYTDDIEKLGKFPIFYQFSEFEIFGNSLCGSKSFKMKQNLIQEHQIITRYLNIEFDLDNYMAFRTQNELFKNNNNNQTYLIPFINLFDLHPKFYNAEKNFNNETGEIEIKSLRNIDVGEVITLENGIEDNCENLLYYGITYDYSNNKYYKPILPIKLYSDPYDEYVIDKKIQKYVDIKDDNYIDLVLEEYKINRPGPSEINQLNFFYDSLQRYLYEFGVIKTRDYWDKIFTRKNRLNIKRIYESERKLIEQRMEELKEYVRKKREKNKNNSDL